jgi:hypothetical protein
MKLGLAGVAAAAFVLAGHSPSHAAAVNSVYGVWSNPVVSGTITDAVNGHLTPFNNNGTAVVSITTTTHTNDTLTWGTWSVTGAANPPGQPDPAGCAFLAANFGGVPCFSRLTFTGNPVSSTPLTPFELGQMSYSNGTSNLNSLIFGATLTFYETSSPNPIGTDFVQIVTTNNTSSDPNQNADYIVFNGLSGASFNVLEGGSAVAGMDGIIDGVVLTQLTLNSGAGFIGNSPGLPTPEPATTALLGVALAGLGLGRRYRKTH